MLEYIRNELLGMTDKGEYAAFTSSLIPGCDNIIGIRQPVLKQYAKQLIKENKDFLTAFRPVHRRAREHGHAVALSEVPDA